jgi:sugar phosphate isomerase/epimerase
MLTRRHLIRSAAHAAAAGLVLRQDAAAAAAQAVGSSTGRSPICFFSKHLPELDWTELGRAVKTAGFDGVDLTVRAKGHVLPERAAADLPRAIDAIKAQGLSVPMVTTELTSAADPTAKPLLQAAAKSGVHYFKTGYWRYTESGDVRGQAAAAGAALDGLTALARDCGIVLGFHNHTAYIGAALWDIAPAMDQLDPKWAGYYFDPRHAVAEGGGGAWKAATHLVAPRMKMMALKDFYWEKTAKGWMIRDCPMGKGAVDWAWVAKTISEAKFRGPISLHFEYEIPGSTPREQTKNTLTAAVADLAVARKFFG